MLTIPPCKTKEEELKARTDALKEEVGALIMVYQKLTGLEVVEYIFSNRNPTRIHVRVPD